LTAGNGAYSDSLYDGLRFGIRFGLEPHVVLLTVPELSIAAGGQLRNGNRFSQKNYALAQRPLRP
jgi:hypothetical protein